MTNINFAEVYIFQMCPVQCNCHLYKKKTTLKASQNANMIRLQATNPSAVF